MLMTLSWLVTAAGMFFNWSIKVTVINFTGLFYTPAVNEAVGQVWTNLRDLANIFIIGLFVFIAISIILGLQEFGQKKLIARVVVVAILINFSFLFTQIAINASNFHSGGGIGHNELHYAGHDIHGSDQDGTGPSHDAGYTVFH
jgi:hypothetical protein